MGFISRGSVRVAVYVIAWMGLADWAIGVALAPGRNSMPELQRYFEYGRSVEGKLSQMVSGVRDGRILSAGWIEPEQLKQLPGTPEPGKDLLVAAYGQSFTLNAVNAAAALDSGMTLRPVGGPGAPASHSYWSYRVDAPLRKADVVVFGVLSSTVGHLSSISGLIPMFGNPAPFTFPRYRVVAGKLEEELPLIRSEAEFRAAFSGRSPKWLDFRRQLATADKGYDGFTFSESWIDASTVGRLIRRGWVAHHQGYDDGVYSPENGFDADSDEVRTLRQILLETHALSRSRGERLIVLLLHTQGHGDRLHAVLKDTLEGARIEYISTHSLFSANDPANFLPDGHYVAPANDALSRKLQELVRRKAMAPGAPAVPPTPAFTGPRKGAGT
jgi:hypothetical protein